jgi:hypothetical protein
MPAGGVFPIEPIGEEPEEPSAVALARRCRADEPNAFEQPEADEVWILPFDHAIVQEQLLRGMHLPRGGEENPSGSLPRGRHKARTLERVAEHDGVEFAFGACQRDLEEIHRGASGQQPHTAAEHSEHLHGLTKRISTTSAAMPTPQVPRCSGSSRKRSRAWASLCCSRLSSRSGPISS